MSSLWILNVVGLCVGVCAAVLMYYFPPRVIQYTEKGERQIVWTANATEEGKRLGQWQMRLSQIAPWLLALAFLLQLAAVVIPEFCSNAS